MDLSVLWKTFGEEIAYLNPLTAIPMIGYKASQAIKNKNIQELTPFYASGVTYQDIPNMLTPTGAAKVLGGKVLYGNQKKKVVKKVKRKANKVLRYSGSKSSAKKKKK